MKLTRILALAPLLVLPLACSKSDAKTNEPPVDTTKTTQSSQPITKGLDTSELTAEAMKTKATDLVGEIGKGLQSITDEASATDVRAKLEPLIDQVTQMKTKLGSQMPSLDTISKALEDLKARIEKDASYKETVQPLLDKLQALLK